MAYRFFQRRGTSVEWEALNPILGPAEFGIETDTDIIKIGDGVTAWLDLDPAFEGAFLPLTGKAADADKLDGFESTAFLKVVDAPALAEAEALEARRMVAYSQLTSFTFDLTSENKLFSNGSASALVYTVPADASVDFPIGTVIDSMLTGSGSLTITAAAGVTFVVNGRALATGSSFVVPYQYATVRVYKRSANLWNVYLLSDQDTGWVNIASGSFPAAWTSTTWASGVASAYRVKNGNLFVRIMVTYAVGQTTITPDSSGNITDVTILSAGAIPVAYINPSTKLIFMAFRNGWSQGQGRINADGSVQLTTWATGSTLAATNIVEAFAGPWPVD